MSESAFLAKAYRCKRSARTSFEMRMRSACGWYGTGAPLNRMPVGCLTFAEKELATIEREFGRPEGRQLTLINTS